MQAGGREGAREGRKQGGELEWAAVPVCRRLNFKHRLLFNYYLDGQSQDNWAFRASMNQFPPGIDITFTILSLQGTCTHTVQEMRMNNELNQDAEGVLVLFCFVLSVGFLLLSTSEMLASSHGSEDSGKPVRIQIA